MKFKATWSTAVLVVSVAMTLLFLGIFYWNLFLKPPVQWGELIPLLVLFGAAPFTIRDYTLLPGAILIKRLFWSTRIPLDGLRSASFEPDGMKGSLRTWGNGGLFSITGWYWSKKLGRYRAFVMNQKNIVVLKFENRTIVLSPDSPQEFVSEILKNKGLSNAG